MANGDQRIGYVVLYAEISQSGIGQFTFVMFHDGEHIGHRLTGVKFFVAAIDDRYLASAHDFLQVFVIK